jgi:hypothetical protein
MAIYTDEQYLDRLNEKESNNMENFCPDTVQSEADRAWILSKKEGTAMQAAEEEHNRSSAAEESKRRLRLLLENERYSFDGPSDIGAPFEGSCTPSYFAGDF